MTSFAFSIPTVVHFGSGVSKQVGAEIIHLFERHAFFQERYSKQKHRPKAMIITDKGVLEVGLVEGIAASLSEAQIEHVVFSDVEPNPKDTIVQSAAETFKQGGYSVIVAVGGGSVLDAAKGAALVATHGGQIIDYDGWETVPAGPIAPLIAVPTTAGSGSEVTYWAVITDTSSHAKFGVGDYYLAPVVSIVDPLLTLSLPRALTVATGLDALTHAIEAYTCSRTNPISDALALEAIRLVVKHLPIAAEKGHDVAAREGMMLASTMAGAAFNNADVAGVHCLSEVLGGLYDAPHGALNAIMLPYVMAHNQVACPERYADVSKALGGEHQAEQALILVVELCRGLDVPTLVDLGAQSEDLPLLAKRAEEHPCNESNPIPISQVEYLVILEEALDGLSPLE